MIGAGFSGLALANRLLEAGVEVDIYEEHNKVGFPNHCTGLVSAYTQRLIGRPAVSSELGRFDSFVISGPSESVTLRASEPVIKLNRIRLEELMLEEAESKGAKVHMGVRAGVRPTGEVLPDGKRYDVVILAEGQMGSLRKELGIGSSARPLWGVNLELEAEVNGTFVALFDRRLSDGFFTWLVPLKGFAIVGTAARDPRLLGRLVERVQERFGLAGARRLGIYGGPVISSPPPKAVRVGRVVAVGDAAAMTKPLTGGGLYPSAEAAVRAAKMILGGADPADAVEVAVKAVLSEQAKSYRLSRLLHEDPSLVDLLARAAKRSGLDRGSEGRVDYDRHMSVFSLALSSSRSLIAAAYLLRRPADAMRMLGSVLAGYLGL